MSSLYKDQAGDAINALFKDKSQPADEKLEALCQLRDQIKTLIAVLKTIGRKRLN